MANFDAIEPPGDVIWCPVNLVGVILVARLEVLNLLRVHLSPGIDDVRSEGSLGDFWDDFDVDLIPVLNTPREALLSLPVGKEGADGA